jgi:16S rRNA (adenine1518-N6/adenine1519-N6)-dimethyltransferase
MSRISKLLSEAGLSLKKSLGQNFLVSQPVLERIANACGATPKSLVLEIGCGLGNLTEMIAKRSGHVLAVELDERFKNIHRRMLAPLGNVDVLYGDFMDVDIKSLLKRDSADADLRLAGNIPYHLTSPIIFKLLASEVEFDGIILLMQREVAHRLCAKPTSQHWGILSAKTQVRFNTELLFTVPPGAFLPPPKIHSALVRLTPRAEGSLVPDLEERQKFFTFIDAAFAQRRKFLAKSVTAAAQGMLDREAVEAALTVCGMPPNTRAEELSSEQLLALFHALGSPQLPTVRKQYEA